MTLLTWITLSLLLVLPETVSTEPEYNATNTKLLLLVDMRRDPSLTVTRVKNIASYFVSRVKDGLIKTLDVSLLDQFQEKTLFNLTNVTSSAELTFALAQVDQKHLNSDEHKDNFYVKSNLSWTFDHCDKIVNEIDEKLKANIFIVIFLLGCHGNFKELTKLSYLHYKTNSMLKLLFLFDMSSNENIILNSTKIEYGRDHLVYIDPRDDFATYNPVLWVFCDDFTKCWTKYIWSGHRASSYRIELLDTPISWSEANKICNSKRSSLPAIETEDELQFLKEFLQDITNKTDYPSMSLIRNTVVISVSLFKKRELQYHNFMWLNLRPFNIEADFESSEDISERCATVNFLFKAENQKDEIKWKAVNCDEPISKILVCEMESQSLLLHKEQSAKILAIEPKRQNDSIGYILAQLVKLNTVKLNESDGMLHCIDYKNKIILYSFVCDGEQNCENRRDEQYCPKTFLYSNQLCITRSGVENKITYIPSKARCNKIQDCPDNSDEQGCDGCLGRQCEDGTCVPSHWLSRDREQCNLFIGTNRNWYLNVSYPRTSQYSWLVHFHHEITFCDVSIKNSSNVKWAPKCLYMRGSDGSTTGCQNNRHLRDCSTFQCPEGFLKCPDSYCVPVYNFVDKQNDCPYGEDEIGSLYSLFDEIDNTFSCMGINIFIHLVHICDGVAQCPRGEDEAFCNVTCPPGFLCNGQAVAVANTSIVPVIKSLNIFDIKTKYLNVSGIDLSKVTKPFILPNLLEIHASNCNIDDVYNIFENNFENKITYHVNLSYNKIKELPDGGPFRLLHNLLFLNLSNNKQLSKIGPLSMWSSVLHTVFELDALEHFQTLASLILFQTNIVQIGSLISIQRLDYFNLQKTSLSTDKIAVILKEVSVSTSLFVDHFKFCCPQISGAGTPHHACHAPPEAISSCEDLLSDVLKRSLLWLVAGVSLAGNIIVVTYRLFYDRGVFKKGYGIFVTNLSCSDCVMGVYLLIIAFTDVRYRDECVLHENDWRHSSLCQAAGFLSTLSSETSTFFVFLITLDRYLVIRFPFGDYRFTKLGLILCVLFVWIIGFILASFPLIYPEWIIYSSNGMCLGLPLALSRNLGWHYSFGIFICVNFLMFVFITCGQILMFRSLLSGKRFEMTNVQSAARRVQEEINIAKQLSLVVLSNFLCWFPICVLGFLTLTGHEVSPDIYAWLVVFVMPLNAAINPVIYTIPVIYSKWRAFKEGKTARTQRHVSK